MWGGGGWVTRLVWATSRKKRKFWPQPMLWIPATFRVHLWCGGKGLGPGVLPPTRDVNLGKHLPSWGRISKMLREAYVISNSHSNHQN